MEEIHNSPTKLQRIIRWLPHKLSIWWFELTGGLKKPQSELFGMKIKEDGILKNGEFRLEMEKEISLSDKIVSVNRSMNDFIQTKHVKEFIRDILEDLYGRTKRLSDNEMIGIIQKRAGKGLI